MCLHPTRAAHDAVVRLPKGVAIERALLKGVPDDEIVVALQELSAAYPLHLPAGWEKYETRKSYPYVRRTLVFKRHRPAQ